MDMFVAWCANVKLSQTTIVLCNLFSMLEGELPDFHAVGRCALSFSSVEVLSSSKHELPFVTEHNIRLLHHAMLDNRHGHMRL
jgi:hypothetical protein